ncbi:hypothetical protein ACFO3C_22345 [Halostagnicola sp. GCM10023398]|uniref:hypothetical protein n=1 Tax=Natrialbaceae TaxID=1644061 RepID=UPI003613F010
MRRELATVLGFPAIRAAGSYDLEPERLETEAKSGYERRKWHIRTEPGFRIPFYLLISDAADLPYSVVLTVHWHCEDGKALTVGVVGDDRTEIAEK